MTAVVEHGELLQAQGEQQQAFHAPEPQPQYTQGVQGTAGQSVWGPPGAPPQQGGPDPIRSFLAPNCINSCPNPFIAKACCTVRAQPPDNQLCHWGPACL